MASTWSKARLDLLRSLAKEKQSASQIAAAMSEKFGATISRNAVIGQATRNGIQLDGPRFRGGRPKSARGGAKSSDGGAGAKALPYACGESAPSLRTRGEKQLDGKTAGVATGSPEVLVQGMGRPRARAGVASGPSEAATPTCRQPAAPVVAIPIAAPAAEPRRRTDDVGEALDLETAEAELSNAAKAVLALRHGQCRWPIGDTRGGDFHFCCEPVAGVGSYCGEHAQASIGQGTVSERSAIKTAMRIA